MVLVFRLALLVPLILFIIVIADITRVRPRDFLRYRTLLAKAQLQPSFEHEHSSHLQEREGVIKTLWLDLDTQPRVSEIRCERAQVFYSPQKTGQLAFGSSAVEHMENARALLQESFSSDGAHQKVHTVFCPQASYIYKSRQLEALTAEFCVYEADGVDFENAHIPRDIHLKARAKNAVISFSKGQPTFFAKSLIAELEPPKENK